MDPFEDFAPVRFTNILRDKIRAQRGQSKLPMLSEADTLKAVTKRNKLVKNRFNM
jgi:hypothetical protein